MDGPLRVMGVREEPSSLTWNPVPLWLCYTKPILQLELDRHPESGAEIRNISYLLIIFRTDTIDFFKKTVDGKNYKGAPMQRKPVDFKKSASSFKKRAKLVHKKNTPSYRNSRGGIRL